MVLAEAAVEAKPVAKLTSVAEVGMAWVFQLLVSSQKPVAPLPDQVEVAWTEAAARRMAEAAARRIEWRRLDLAVHIGSSLSWLRSGKIGCGGNGARIPKQGLCGRGN